MSTIKKILFPFVCAFVFFLQVTPAKADWTAFQQNVDTYSDSVTLYNRTDCTTSTDGAKCRFEFLEIPSGIVLRTVEFSFEPQGAGAATAKACLYSVAGIGDFTGMTQRVCSTADAVPNTDHRQTFTFTTPYVVTTTGYFAVSIEHQSGDDRLVMGNAYAAGGRTCYRQGSTPPVNCGSVLSLYYKLNADDAIVSSGAQANPFTDNQIGLTDFLSSYPDHDTAVGACANSTFGDYWECFWSYIEYYVVPSSVPIFNSLTKPYTALQTRWPFGYILIPVESFRTGLATNTTTCPLQDIGGGTFLGSTIPDIAICDYLDDVKTAAEANALAQSMLVIIVYVAFGTTLMFSAKSFLHG